VPDLLSRDGLDLRLQDFGRSKILVVGEAVLGSLCTWGNWAYLSRSPDSGAARCEAMMNGPGNATFVSANLAALGAKPSLLKRNWF
jgi:bifunctional ADP-heptose synthase (sugar kinase/adenylyltransferase)